MAAPAMSGMMARALLRCDAPPSSRAAAVRALGGTAFAVSPGVVRGRSGVAISNGLVELFVLHGGGHIAGFSAAGGGVNPLCFPPWTTRDPALRCVRLCTWPVAARGGGGGGGLPARHGRAHSSMERGSKLPSAEFEGLEGELLSSIAGHNLCLDVFGAHSAGEVAAGLAFHGEAGLVTWCGRCSCVRTMALCQC